MTQEEIAILESEAKGVNWSVWAITADFVYIILSFYFDVIFFSLVLQLPIAYQVTGWLFFIIFPLQIFFFFKLRGLNKKKYMQDLNSPIFRVQGEGVPEIIKSKYGPVYYFLSVRGVKFSQGGYSELPSFVEALEKNQEVLVEYSPRTKHIWNIYKV